MELTLYSIWHIELTHLLEERCIQISGGIRGLRRISVLAIASVEEDLPHHRAMKVWLVPLGGVRHQCKLGDTENLARDILDT
jgi:hypothetical protein